MRSKPFEQELVETLRTIRSLKARVPDEMEDYLHDSIVAALSQGKIISRWWGYIYQAIKLRLRFGREAQPYTTIEDSILPSVERVGIDTRLDLYRALSLLSERKRMYIMQYFFEGYTLKEMAEKHEVSFQYINKLISQALCELRELLREDKYDSEC